MRKLLVIFFLFHLVSVAKASEILMEYVDSQSALDACLALAGFGNCSPINTLPGFRTFEHNFGDPEPVFFSSLASQSDFIAEHLFRGDIDGCPSGTVADETGLCVPNGNACVAGITQTIFRNLSSTSTEVPPASQVQLDDGCDYDVVLESCNIFSSGPDTPIGDIANNGDGTSTLCSYTATSTGTSGDASTDLTFDGDLPPDIDPLDSTDTRESTQSTETDPPTTQTNTDGSTSTTTSSTTTETTSSGTDLNQNGDQVTSTTHNEFITTTTTTTTTTTFTNGDVTSSRDVTETNTGGGTTTRRLNPDGSIEISGTEDQDNTTTTNTISNINADGSGDSNTTGGECVGEGCSDEDSGGVCELAPVLCDAAEFILEVVTLPDHPDLPIADESTGESLDTSGFVAPGGTCLANPTVSVFGNNVELPFDQTVCAFCDLMRPIMIVIASFVAIGVLLGGRSD